MDKNEPFQEGSEKTSLSAEEMNRRIVRPLNAFLKMVATPPLRLVKCDSAWLLQDDSAVGSVSPDTNIPIPTAPPPACAIPNFSNAIGKQVNVSASSHCGGPGSSSNFVQAAMSGMTHACTYTLRFHLEIAFPTSGATVEARLSVGGTHYSWFSTTGGDTCGVETRNVTQDVPMTGDLEDLCYLFYLISNPSGSHVATGYLKITNIELLSSQPT